MSIIDSGGSSIDVEFVAANPSVSFANTGDERDLKLNDERKDETENFLETVLGDFSSYCCRLFNLVNPCDTVLDWNKNKRLDRMK